MIEKERLPIRLVCATRVHRKLFLTDTATGRSIKSFINISKTQLRLYGENNVGLSKIYNEVIEESKTDPAILVFMHDDILIY